MIQALFHIVCVGRFEEKVSTQLGEIQVLSQYHVSTTSMKVAKGIYGSDCKPFKISQIN